MMLSALVQQLCSKSAADAFITEHLDVASSIQGLEACLLFQVRTWGFPSLLYHAQLAIWCCHHWTAPLQPLERHSKCVIL